MITTKLSLIRLLAVVVVSSTSRSAFGEASQHYYTDHTGLWNRNYPFSSSSTKSYVSKSGFAKSNEFDKLGPLLTQVYKEYEDNDPQTFSASSVPTGQKFPHINNDKVLVDVIGEDKSIYFSLKKSVLYMDIHGCFNHVCSVHVPVENLVILSRIPGVRYVRPSIPKTFKGSVTSGGVADLGIDTVQESLGLNGTGLLICVLSDSYDCLGGAANDIATGDLPSDVEVVKEYMESDCSDEGRAMLQLIHDVAPAADLAFRTGFEGAADMATGIMELADLGCDIIVDDIGYVTEPFFQDGMVAQAASAVAEQGIHFFSAAGNTPSSQSWDAVEGFVDSGVGLRIDQEEFGTFHSFGTDESGSPILYQPIGEFDTTMADGSESIVLALQWDEPFFSANGLEGSSSDVDFFIFELQEEGWWPREGSFVINIGGDASELVVYSFANVTEPRVTLGMAITLADGSPPPSYMKVLSIGVVEVAYSFPTFSSSCYGHPNIANVAGVGAAASGQTGTPPVVQDYSSTGGTPIFFDANGNRLDEPEVRMQPRFVGPDEAATTFFGEENIFPGTSASAPHIAAVAALMLQAKSDLSPLKLFEILQETAVDMDDPQTADFDVGFDFATGYGFVDALAALNAITDEVTPAPSAEGGTPAPTAEATPESTVKPTPEVTVEPTPEVTPGSKSAKSASYSSKSAKSASYSSKSAKSASYSGSSKSRRRLGQE